MEEVRHSSIMFTSTLHGGEWSALCFYLFNPGERAHKHCKWNQVGLRESLVIRNERKLSCPNEDSGLKSWFLGHSVCSMVTVLSELAKTYGSSGPSFLLHVSQSEQACALHTKSPCSVESGPSDDVHRDIRPVDKPLLVVVIQSNCIMQPFQ
jgi:hypothetical protein